MEKINISLESWQQINKELDESRLLNSGTRIPPITFEKDRKYDILLLGRAAVDFNPVDYYKPLSESTTFKKYLGGSPANIAVGMARLGKKTGFIGKVSDDQFGDFILDYFTKEGIDTAHVTRCGNGEKTGLTFTEILDEKTSSILMYRNGAADLQLSTDDINEDYIKQSAALLISGTALAMSPSREAALKALFLAVKHNTKVIFDIDYRPYSWKGNDEIAIYYSIAAENSDIILGSREEFDLMEALICKGRTDEESAAYWHKKGVKIVVIKHGGEGSLAYTADGSRYKVKPFPVKLLKSFGGGDGYASAFLYGLFEGFTMVECLEFGSASAALLVASHGCSEDMPSAGRIHEFIEENRLKYGSMAEKMQE